MAHKLKEIFIMGGNMEGVGNCSLGAEFNFFADSEAAFIVLQSVKCPTYLATWELCLSKSRVDTVRTGLRMGLCTLFKMAST